MKTAMQELIDYLDPIHSAIKDKAIELLKMEKEQKKVEITRLEVINHAKNDMPIGRILTIYKELEQFNSMELSYQDGGMTLKIFLD